ncbi:hypothetical protein ACIPEN_22090 [Herbaspirillum chlorophenolicum]|uniref:Transposase n=1 Tax=Herbaspirillum chlorophenolicum TaxID=211589 RepID=A0ABW8F5G1_9BURK
MNNSFHHSLLMQCIANEQKSDGEELLYLRDKVKRLECEVEYLRHQNLMLSVTSLKPFHN